MWLPEADSRERVRVNRQALKKSLQGNRYRGIFRIFTCPGVFCELRCPKLQTATSNTPLPPGNLQIVSSR